MVLTSERWQAGVEQLFNQLMRPKLRTLITDVYKDVSYVLDDDEYSTTEYQDVVRKRFVKSWESLTDGYKVVYTFSADVMCPELSFCRISLRKATTALYLDLHWMWCCGHGRGSL